MKTPDQETINSADGEPDATNTEQKAKTRQLVYTDPPEDLGGWLLFFTVCFAIGGLIYAGQLLNPGNTLNVTLAVVVAVLSLVTVILIALKRRLGRWSAIAAYFAGAVHTTVLAVLSLTAGGPSPFGFIQPSTNNTLIPLGIYWVVIGLLSLYFVVSRRVKDTLIR